MGSAEERLASAAHRPPNLLDGEVSSVQQKPRPTYPQQHESGAGQTGDDRRRRAGHERPDAPGCAQVRAGNGAPAKGESRRDGTSGRGIGPGESVRPVGDSNPPDNDHAPPRFAAHRGGCTVCPHQAGSSRRGRADHSIVVLTGRPPRASGSQAKRQCRSAPRLPSKLSSPP